ncbi:MAG: hypothetical protein L6R39_006916 [Caloplaca ligustica]|nr:MAG: hypothetical protein L6R39_006916 [Caloplaca ligustica]
MESRTQSIKQKWQSYTSKINAMVAKVKAYGKQGKENVAVQLKRLHTGDTSPEERQPLLSIDPNVESRPSPPKPKPKPKPKKKNKKHRKSLVFNSTDDIQAAGVDSPTRWHLEPLLQMREVTTKVLDFGDWSRVWSSHCNFTKIAHGTYGAVFRIESKAEPGTFTIGKLIPLQAKSGLGSKTKEFTSPEAAHNEVELLTILDELPGFVQFRKAEVLQGALPEALKDASIAFDVNRDQEDMSRWWARACDHSPQLWLFLEMSDAGTDLETLYPQQDQPDPGLPNPRRPTVTEVRDIFWQVACALARAEQRFEFEHRDLHLGNICLRLPEEPVSDGGSMLCTENPSVLVTIIDYTLSYARAPQRVNPTFYDLSRDRVLFEGTGARQYDVYRDMMMATRGKWSKYTPFTNVLWLYHLLHMLLDKTAETYLDTDKIVLRQHLVGLKKWMMDNSGEKALGSAQDVVRYCEQVGQEGKQDEGIGRSTEPDKASWSSIAAARAF